MASVHPQYPFLPKSNALLRPGQFFSFKLADGQFACGRVLALQKSGGTGSRTMFLVGLMDWHGDAPARTSDLVGRGIIAQGWAHIIIFSDYAAPISGFRPLETDNIVPNLKCEVTYGREVLRIRANQRFASTLAIE